MQQRGRAYPDQCRPAVSKHEENPSERHVVRLAEEHVATAGGDVAEQDRPSHGVLAPAESLTKQQRPENRPRALECKEHRHAERGTATDCELPAAEDCGQHDAGTHDPKPELQCEEGQQPPVAHHVEESLDNGPQAQRIRPGLLAAPRQVPLEHPEPEHEPRREQERDGVRHEHEFAPEIGDRQTSKGSSHRYRQGPCRGSERVSDGQDVPADQARQNGVAPSLEKRRRSDFQRQKQIKEPDLVLPFDQQHAQHQARPDQVAEEHHLTTAHTVVDRPGGRAEEHHRQDLEDCRPRYRLGPASQFQQQGIDGNGIEPVPGSANQLRQPDAPEITGIAQEGPVSAQRDRRGQRRSLRRSTGPCAPSRDAPWIPRSVRRDPRCPEAHFAGNPDWPSGRCSAAVWDRAWQTPFPPRPS